jgi:hypothetical protein
MIPRAKRVRPFVRSPLPQTELPSRDEISEEGFGPFRSTWWTGRARIRDAEALIVEEREIIRLIDGLAKTPSEYEDLATSVEHRNADELARGLFDRASASPLAAYWADADDFAPLEGLEIGVAGLAAALAATGSVTAASCRWHIRSQTWSPCPVVYFATRQWRLEILADLIATERCGLDADRGMVYVYGASIKDTHRLAEALVRERSRFRRAPVPRRRPARRPQHKQLSLALTHHAASQAATRPSTRRESKVDRLEAKLTAFDAETEANFVDVSVRLSTVETNTRALDDRVNKLGG